MTIAEAIKNILVDSPKGLTSSEIYQRIVDSSLYTFRAENPVSSTEAYIMVE